MSCIKKNNNEQLCLPDDIEESAKRGSMELLQKKSAQQDDIAYSNFLCLGRPENFEGMN